MGRIGDFFYHLIIVILVAAALVFLLMAFKEQYPIWKNQQELENLRSKVEKKKTKNENPHINWENLKSTNPEIVGWIKVPGTKIDYPILQGKEWNEYLHKNYKEDYSYAGSIFIQPEAAFNDQHLIIYGHNMKNNTMFGSLPKYSKQEYYEEHSVLYLLTPKQNYKVKLIAGYVTPSDSKVYEFEKTKEERSGLLKTALDNSLFTSGTTVSDEDRLLTLSTCSYEYDNARFVLMGILKEIG